MSLRGEDLPADIYASLVASLFRNAAAFFVGAVTSTAAAILTAWKTGDPWLWFCAAGLGAIGLARTLDMRWLLERGDPTTSPQFARFLELRYAFTASIHAIFLGLWGFLSAMNDDPVVHLLSATVIIGFAVGMSGRNFGRPMVVVLQVLLSCTPLVGGLMLRQDPYYMALAVFIVLFFAGLFSISSRLHQNLLQAVIATRNVGALATRFDTALNNMPHALAMFDSELRLVVSNGRLVELLGLSAQIAERDVRVHELLMDCVRAGTILSVNAEEFANDFVKRLLSGKKSDDLVLEVQGGRTLSLTFQPMDNGGSVVLIEDITERRQAEAQINHLARFDPLTGLPNRTFFRDQTDKVLNLTRRTDDKCALLFIDLDQFKQVNDTLGHTAGDRLLCVVAERLRSLVRQGDVVARFGGDEFVVLQSPVSNPDEARGLAERIVQELGGAYEIDGHRLVIGASVGIAMAPMDGDGADMLLKNADMALYRAKADGRGTWRFFEPDMDSKAQSRRRLELDLRHALANYAFEVFYQPIYNLRTKRISSCEALLRWPHPERGMISPAEFIPIAEEMGLIVEIGNWVLRQACRECLKWPNDIRVAVNLSAIQFRKGSVVDDVRDALAATGLPPSRLELEITESVLLQDTEAAQAALYQLRELGVRISLDDFGTGYSSLSYLHSLPLHKVKIDRSFLAGLSVGTRSLTLLRGVTRLSAELGMAVVVEGVETHEQLSVIAAEESVDEAQGFLFSRPVPGRDIRALLQAPTPLQVARKVA